MTKKRVNLYFRLFFLFLPVIIGNEIDGNAQVTEATRSANAMQIGFGHLWKVKVNYNVNGLNVNASCE